MIVRETSVSGVLIVEPEPSIDERGLFARTFCAGELAQHGISMQITQASTSYNERRGTLRGMHLQRAPHEEAKIVRCTRGVVFDVAVDLRADSATFLRWAAVELSAETRRELFVPTGCAHGFLTLEDATELEYLISVPYAPKSAAGVRWDDPAIGIDWPFAPKVMGDRDRSFPLLDVARLRSTGLAALSASPIDGAGRG
jgi:dTDP-4-dehydrorhamnose 3,5-epimerase